MFGIFGIALLYHKEQEYQKNHQKEVEHQK